MLIMSHCSASTEPAKGQDKKRKESRPEPAPEPIDGVFYRYPASTTNGTTYIQVFPHLTKYMCLYTLMCIDEEEMKRLEKLEGNLEAEMNREFEMGM